MDSLSKAGLETKLIKCNEDLHTEIFRKGGRHSPEQLRKLKDSKDEVFEKLSAIAIRRRNQTSAHSIQRTLHLFAENGQEQPASEGQTSTPTPAEPPPTCPVFCVSAKAYEQLSGRDRSERLPGFSTKYDTQIPQLREHCLSASLNAREEHERQFFESLTNFKDELRAWALDTSPERAIDAQQKATLEAEFESILRDLEQVRCYYLTLLNMNFYY